MGIHSIRPHQLVILYILATEGSFTATADRLFLTEPAISQQVRDLQLSTGIKLVYQKKKRVYLTEAGQVLYKYGEVIYNQVRSAEEFLGEIITNSLRIGVSVSFSNVATSASIQFQKLFPDVSLRIKSITSHVLIDQLLDLYYDVGIVASTDYKAEYFKAIRLSDAERLVLVTSRSTPFYKSDYSFTLAALQDYQIIIPREGSATREVLLNRFKAEGLELKNPIVMDMDYQQYGKLLAEISNSITFMPEIESYNLEGQDKLRILHPTNNITIGVNALFVKNSYENEMAHKFTKLVKQTFDDIHTAMGVP